MLSKENIVMYSNMLKNGSFDESAKIEFKREWWDLGNPVSISEFLKDITAMVNTPGDTGYIVVGLDKTGTFFDSPIPTDPATIKGIIIKRIQEPMNIEFDTVEIEKGKTVTIIEIPYSPNKPHVIKEYLSPKSHQVSMFIPIRKSTSINSANKYDLDFMYFEKNKRFIIDYALDIKVPNVVPPQYGGNKVFIPVVIVNKGINVNCVTRGQFNFEADSPELKNQYDVSAFTFVDKELSFKRSEIIKIPSNDMVRTNFVIMLDNQGYRTFLDRNELNLRFSISINDVMDNTFVSDLFLVRNPS